MYLLIGINSYAFTDSKTGQLVEGNNVHLINDSPESKNFVGRAVLKFSLSNAKLQDFLAGRTIADVIDTEVAINYNQYGKVASMVSCG